jgi:N-acetylglucosaminyl-diphospho-decaprenol L-rhamnosyltransferase
MPMSSPMRSGGSAVNEVGAFSIVVVTWRSAVELGRLVGSIRSWLDPLPDVVVVDNASGDGVETALAQWPGQKRCVTLAKNVGFGAAANLGVSLSSDMVVLLNPDTLLVDASLKDLVQKEERLNALVGPRLLNADYTVQPSASGPPTGVWPWVGAVIPGAIAPRAIKARTAPWRLERLVSVSWLAGACVAAPRTLLASLGPFDPAIHLFGEDLDLCVRAARAGVVSYLAPDSCRIVHYGSRSVAQIHHDHGASLRAASQRAVIRRIYGARAERRSWRGYRLNLALRLLSRRLLRRDVSAHRCREWQAAVRARYVVELPAGELEPAAKRKARG